MERGEVYRVRRPLGGPKSARVLVVVSRQPTTDSAYATVICAPVFTQWHELSTQIHVSAAEGPKHESAIQCDGLMSLDKSRLAGYLRELSADKSRELGDSLTVALGVSTRARPTI